jgi:DNA-binding NarL/FixJ family response regulator
MINILIADDQKTVQDVLVNYLQGESGLEVVGLADDGQIALELVEKRKPDIVLMDIEMPAIDGLTATRIITERFIETKVIILSVHEDDAYLNSALLVGAKGYLLKNTPSQELVKAIFSAYKGYFQLGPGLLEKYLYKITSSEANLAEVNQLKNMLEKQAELLEKLEEQDQKMNQDDWQRRYNALEKQVYNLQYKLEKTTKKLVVVQNFCFFLALACAVLLLIMILLNL